jgi:hypothetical protein
VNNATNIIDDLRLLEPWRAPPPWVWMLLALVVVGIVAFVIRRRNAARRTAEGAHAAAHAHEDALAELEKARALLSPENSRPYGIEVSGIVRRYIECRFNIVAPRRSTEEFLIEAAASARLEAAHRQLLAEFLGSCDFLKFARARAELTELESQHQAAVRFVTETRVVPAKPEIAAMNPSRRSD